MTFALLLFAATVSAVPTKTIAEPLPIIVSIEDRADSPDSPVPSSDTSCDGTEGTAFEDVNEYLFAPVDPICTGWCHSQRVFCCADPYESCNYTCETQFIVCLGDCRLNN